MANQMKKALPIWGEQLSESYNQFLGFRANLTLEEGRDVIIRLVARTFYRLFLNGEPVMNGPARTTKGYCRIDEIQKRLRGTVKIAVEVTAFSKDKRYSNDHTMEPGMLAVEVLDAASGEILTSTGDGNWRYTELSYRVGMTDLMSHCRGIVEYYRLSPQNLFWTTLEQDMPEFTFCSPVILPEQISWLERRAPYPTYAAIPFERLEQVTEIKCPANDEKDSASRAETPEQVLERKRMETAREDEMISLAKIVNPGWEKLVPPENRFLESLLSEHDTLFTGACRETVYQGKRALELLHGDGNTAFTFSIPALEVGFLHLLVQAEKKTVLDIINTDHLNAEGCVDSNSYVCRYELEPGTYDLLTMEPKLCQYVKLIVRTTGKVKLSYPELLDDTYPDQETCTFRCSDGDLNRIYEGAKRTLRLNTLDIFMDCPERERGGWLCDSYFSGYAAWQLFGDLKVEQDFLENFLLTDASDYRDGFFPEVYPGSNASKGDPGIETWSFWLLAELESYAKRAKDRTFLDQHYPRVKAFLDGVKTHLGESGLFEHFSILFVDWSLSNHPVCLEPISLPVNCLIACAYRLMGELYGQDEWKQLAAQVTRRIEEVWRQIRKMSDGCRYENGHFIGNGVRTESGIALEFWSGFHKEDLTLRRQFLDEMGPCPKERPNPNIGGLNLFIGMMIRFEVLARLGETKRLLTEMKSVYLPQLREGQGTLFEGIQAKAGCHGFNGMAGALLTDQFLGLGSPNQKEKTVVIAPDPCGRTWAYGRKQCADGTLTLRWSADQMTHELDLWLFLPEGWKPEIQLPFSLCGWTVRVNGKILK